MEEIFSLLDPKILKRVGKLYKRSHYNVTFGDFIRYAFSSHPPVPKNMHWDTMENLCEPCKIKYDFIVKMETFNQDSHYILSKIFNSNISLTTHGTQTGTGDSLVVQWLSELPKELRMKVIHFYDHDAQLFDYEMKNYT